VLANEVNESITKSHAHLEGEKERLREENRALQKEVARLSALLNDLRSRPPQEPENDNPNGDMRQFEAFVSLKRENQRLIQQLSAVKSNQVSQG